MSLVYWHTSPMNACQVIWVWAYAIVLVFEGHICCWHILCSSMVNRSYSVLIFDGCVQ